MWAEGVIPNEIFTLGLSTGQVDFGGAEISNLQILCALRVLA